jgi:hypothetical protein
MLSKRKQTNATLENNYKSKGCPSMKDSLCFFWSFGMPAQYFKQFFGFFGILNALV